MVRLKISWGKEAVFPVSDLVKQPDFPIKRSAATISRWIREGVRTTRGSRVAFPGFLVGIAYHSSVSAAREFVAYLGQREADSRRRLAKECKMRRKAVKA